MKTNILLLALLSLFAGFASCNKSDETEPVPWTLRIKTAIQHKGAAVSSDNYAYDTWGRIVKITFYDGAYAMYEYRTGMIIVTTAGDNRTTDVDTLRLNEQGLVCSQLHGTITHDYASDGKIAKTRLYDALGGLEYDYKTAEENISGYEIWDKNPENPQLLITYSYEYLANSVNTIGLENMGMAFFGKQDKNLISKSISTMLIQNDRSITNYHYEYDSQNRVTKKWTGSNAENYTEYIYCHE